MWILSLTFFRAKIFICFFISLSFPKEYGIYKGGGGGEFRELGPAGVSVLGGATCRGSVDLGSLQYVYLKKQLNPADAFF